MSVITMHLGQTTKAMREPKRGLRGINKNLISLCRWFLLAVLIGTPAFAGAQEAEDAEAVPQTELEAAPVVAAKELEDAAVPQTEVEDAAVTPQTELEDAPVVPQTLIEEIVVTGSRIARTPGELAGNLVVLGEEFIQASGEATLERVLRQLPQNLNSTSEQFGSELNTVRNFTGGSTVNLRGLGAESTLILIDGKRTGYNGFLGGVTDISKIPLSMVERIEVILDGASAIYGSDAVGGVVNIITRKDYEGVELDLNYVTPDGGSYDEWRGSIAGALDLEGTRVRLIYSHSGHSGLDGSEREATLFQRSIFPGPQYDVRFCCAADGTASPILYRLDGDALTLSEYNALSPEDQARASAETHAVLPQGFNENSSIDDITQFGVPDWGPETQAGFHILPEETRDSFSASVERDFGLQMSATAHLRYETRDTTYNGGYIGFSGQTIGGGNPFNPFGRNVHLRGQRPDMGVRSTNTQSDSMNLGIDFEGSFNENWDWEAGFGLSSEEANSRRLNSVDGTTLRAGLSSDGVSPRIAFLSGETVASCAEMGGTFSFGFCRVSLPPFPSINPFGDLSPYINPALLAGSTNEQTRFDALVRGGLWAMPAGEVKAMLGYSRHSTSLEGESEFQIGTTDSPIGDIETFHTEAERSNQALYTEALVPLLGDPTLSLSLSARWDAYDKPDALYRESDTETVTVQDVADPGDRTTWGAGLVFTPWEGLRFRLNSQTAFVAPQLNQVLRQSSSRIASGFGGLLIQEPDGSLSRADALILEGGNPDLKPEVADTLSAGFEFNPVGLEGLGFKATWNRTNYEDRISRLSNPIIDRDNPPTGTTYSSADDVWFQERRWINVSSVNRDGIDYELYYATANELGDFTLQFRHSRTGKYDFTVDPATDDPISVVEHTNGRTAIGVVSRAATTAQLIWSNPCGLETSLDLSSRSKTSSTLAGVTNTYEPPTLIDLRLSYHFGEGTLLPSPDWAAGTRVSLTVNNLGDSFGETSSVDDAGESLELGEASRLPQFGRVFNLTMHMSL